MPIESTFQHLVVQGRKLRDSLSELRITIAEDKPLHGVVKLVDALSDSIEDSLSDAEQAVSAASDAQQAIAQLNDWGHWSDLRRALISLIACQTVVNQLQQSFFSELVCYSTMDDIVKLGGQRGGEWQVWANLVRQTLDRCQRQLFDFQQSLFQCWQEIVERAIPNTDSVQAISGSKNIVLLNDHKPEQKKVS